MKSLITASLSAVLLLGACQTTTGDPSASAPTVIDSLIGKTLTTEGGTIILNADGTVGGAIQGAPVVGVYSANSREVCSSYTSPERLAGREICSTPTITGDTVIFERRDGSQSPTYTIGG